MRQNFWQKLKTSFQGGQAILALAPMAGITDSLFRQICKEFGADVVYSEMASASALFFHFRNKNAGRKTSGKNLVCNRKLEKTLKLVRFENSERPYVVQLFGKNPEHFARAAQIITEKTKPDGIDINFGCPAPKVFRESAGCSLMLDKKLSRKIISAVCQNTHLPVSLKIRSGIRSVDALDFIEYLKDLPFSAVMIHGRRYEDGFSGPVNFEMITKIKEIIPDKIVLANGGINSPGDALQVLQDYPALDGLGIARGALGRPFIFSQIKDLIKNGSYKNYPFSEIKKVMIHHAEMIWKEKREAGIVEMRTHLAWYVKGFSNASELRRKLVRAKSLKEIKEILK